MSKSLVAFPMMQTVFLDGLHAKQNELSAVGIQIEEKTTNP
jgi:hypothetical protein